jgi:hypothetical protein
MFTKLQLKLTIVGLTVGIAVSAQAQSLERLFYSPYYKSVEEGMLEGGKNQAIYSYILANASTPGVDLIALLPPKDRVELLNTLPEEATDEEKNSAILEFVLGKMSVNNRRTTTLSVMWGNKAKSLKNVVTLGK